MDPLQWQSLQIFVKVHNVLKMDSNNRMLKSSNYREKIAVGRNTTSHLPYWYNILRVLIFASGILTAFCGYLILRI